MSFGSAWLPGKWLWRSCSIWRLSSNKRVHLNSKAQTQTGDVLAQMEGDLPAQANAVNVGYVCHQERLEQSSLTVNLNNRSILHGASLPVISGGEFNSSEGGHNRITINIRKTSSSRSRFLFNNWYLDQGMQRHRDDRHESVSS
jgi:hypothetical protein